MAQTEAEGEPVRLRAPLGVREAVPQGEPVGERDTEGDTEVEPVAERGALGVLDTLVEALGVPPAPAVGEMVGEVVPLRLAVTLALPVAQPLAQADTVPLLQGDRVPLALLEGVPQADGVMVGVPVATGVSARTELVALVERERVPEAQREAEGRSVVLGVVLGGRELITLLLPHRVGEPLVLALASQQQLFLVDSQVLQEQLGQPVQLLLLLQGRVVLFPLTV